MLPAQAGKKIRGSTVNRGPCPGVVLTLCAIMSTDQTGGAAAAGAVRACLSWAWGRLCWCWCCPGAIALRLYFTAFGDSSPSRQSLRRCFVLCCSSPFIPPSLPFASIRAARGGFALFFSLFRLFALLPGLFLRDIPILFVLLLCYSVFAYPFYCLIFYSIAARLMPGRALLCVLIAGFSPGRVVRCIMSAFSLACARI